MGLAEGSQGRESEKAYGRWARTGLQAGVCSSFLSSPWPPGGTRRETDVCLRSLLLLQVQKFQNKSTSQSAYYSRKPWRADGSISSWLEPRSYETGTVHLPCRLNRIWNHLRDMPLGTERTRAVLELIHLECEMHHFMGLGTRPDKRGRNESQRRADLISLLPNPWRSEAAQPHISPTKKTEHAFCIRIDNFHKLGARINPSSFKLWLVRHLLTSNKQTNKPQNPNLHHQPPQPQKQLMQKLLEEPKKSDWYLLF